MAVVIPLALSFRRGLFQRRPGRRGLGSGPDAERGVQGQAGKDGARENVADGDRYLVPEPPVAYRNGGLQHHSGGNDKHVDDGMLEALRKECQDGQPHSDDLTDRGARHHGKEGANGHHPVTEHRLHECRAPAGAAKGHVSDRLFLRRGADQIAYRSATPWQGGRQWSPSSYRASPSRMPCPSRRRQGPCKRPSFSAPRRGSDRLPERDTMARRAPMVTIQLQSIAFTNAVPQPAPPRAM